MEEAKDSKVPKVPANGSFCSSRALPEGEQSEIWEPGRRSLGCGTQATATSVRVFKGGAAALRLRLKHEPAPNIQSSAPVLEVFGCRVSKFRPLPLKAFWRFYPKTRKVCESSSFVGRAGAKFQTSNPEGIIAFIT